MTPNLISRLESAPEGNRELDAEIALRCFPESYTRKTPDSDTRNGWVTGVLNGKPFASVEAPRYTTSLDAAMSLVPEGFVWQAMTDYGGYHQAAVSRHNGPFWTDTSTIAATAPLALCAASLKARVSDNQDRGRG